MEWISVKERKPKESGYYFATYRVGKHGDYTKDMVYYRKDEGKWKSGYEIDAWIEDEPYVPPKTNFDRMKEAESVEEMAELMWQGFCSPVSQYDDRGEAWMQRWLNEVAE